MRLTEKHTDESTLLTDTYQSTTSIPKTRPRPSSSRLEHIPATMEDRSLPPPERLYTAVVQSAVKPLSSIEERKRLLKRASWDPTSHQQQFGLPPTGKREHSNRIRMRPIATSNPPSSSIRPISYNERYDRLVPDKPSNPSANHPEDTATEQEPSSSSSSVDTVLQITTRTSPSMDNTDLISDTSAASSITSTANTITSLASTINQYERVSSTKSRPLLGEYHLPDDFNQIDYNFLSSISKSNVTWPSPPTDFIREYDDPASHTTKRSTMTMSISPHRHRPSRSINTIITSMSPLPHTRAPCDTTVIGGSCLKSEEKKKTNGVKKCVHFDWHLPREIEPRDCNDRPSVTVTSSSLSTGSDRENDHKEEEKSETVFISTTGPLPARTVHRSFSLSPSSHLKEEAKEEKKKKHNNNVDVSRRHRPKENVDEFNSPTSRQVTTTSAPRHSTIPSVTDAERLTEEQMPFHQLLVQQSSSTTKKNGNSGGFFNFITRSNSKSLASEEEPTIRRTSSSASQRKSKHSSTNGNQRLSTDMDSLHSPSTSSVNISNEDTDKVRKNRQSTGDNRENTNLSLASIIRSSVAMAMHPSPSTTIKSSPEDSLNNGLLFQPTQSSKEKELFFLSTPKSLATPINESSTTMQTSTLIISTPPQYHYYLYPSESPSKKIGHSTRNVSNVSMNSISTNSSSSSYESPLDDDTSSSSHSKKPVTLPDCVQAFWPPSINNTEQTRLASTIERNQHSNSINDKHPHLQASSIYDDESLSTSNSYRADAFPPPRSLNEEIRAYSEENSFKKQCSRIANETYSQASYSERLRAKSRSISITHRSMAARNAPSPEGGLSRSRSKDQLTGENLVPRNTSRPKSVGQSRIEGLFSPVRQEIYNDFQSKRQFFENRTYTEHAVANNHQHHVTKCSWNDSSSRQLSPPTPPESTIRTTKYFDTSSNQTSLPPTIYRKPVRIVKAVQRSVPSTSLPNESQTPMIPSKEHHHLSSEYMRHLFTLPDHLKRHRPKQIDDNERSRTEGVFIHLTKRLDIVRGNQRVINEELAMNTSLGVKLIGMIESKGEENEIEKLKLHINEIDTITSVLLKLSSRLAKVENDLTMIQDNNVHTKASLLERREKILQKHDEAKALKDGIDRRSRLVTTMLRKYLSDEQFNDYEYFIRMKSILAMDSKDTEETLLAIQSIINSAVSSSDSISSSSSSQHRKVLSTTA